MSFVSAHVDVALIVFDIGGTVLKPIVALIGALFISLASTAALAQTATYNINGTFTAPATGSFSGSYVVNTGSNTIVSANIQVTAGKANDGVADLPSNAYVFSGLEGVTFFAFATAVPAAGLRGGDLAMTGTKAAPGGAINSFTDSVCLSNTCDSIINAGSVIRFGNGTVALAPAPVPTLSEWAMILLGLTLAGGAALVIQRRRLDA